MLAIGCSTSRIVRDLEICADTLYRWKKKKIFKELVNNIIASELAETRFRLAHIADKSLSVLWNIVENSKNDHTRLQAVLHVLRMARIEHLPSPNVTQTVQWVLKHEEEEEADIDITNAQEERPGQQV